MSTYQLEDDDNRSILGWASMALCALSIGLCGLLVGCGASSHGETTPEISDPFEPPTEPALVLCGVLETDGKLYPVYRRRVDGGVR